MIAHDSAEVRAKLQAEARQTTISSFVIAVLFLALVGLILAFVLLPALRTEIPVIVGYQQTASSDDKLQEQKVTQQLQRKPSAPSSSMAKVIASSNATPTAVPVPDFDVPDPSVDFGDSTDFGDGWGKGDGWGDGGGGGATFFGQKASAERIAYVIDYSKSMREDDREKLMRAELTKSLDSIISGSQFQLIFFAGGGWEADDEVDDENGQNLVNDGGKKYLWKKQSDFYDYEIEGEMQQPKWLKASEGKIKAMKKIVQEHKLVGGTDWEGPLLMALSMDPKPQVIYFMTDGASGSNSMKIAKEIGREAKKNGIVINCVSMMEPDAVEAMIELAKRTGGAMTKIEKGGEVVPIPLN